MNPPMYIHSCYVNKRGEDAVVVKEAIRQDDGSIKRKLKIYRNPKRRFWITKPQYRTHQYREICPTMWGFTEAKYVKWLDLNNLPHYVGVYRINL